jgi:hypothetical protein
MLVKDLNRMPTMAMKVFGLGFPVLALFLPLYAGVSDVLQSMSLMRRMLPLGYACVALPILISVAILTIRLKKRVQWQEAVVTLVLPAIAVLPGMFILHRQLFGWWVLFRPTMVPNLVLLTVVTAAYLNVSVLLRDNQSATWQAVRRAAPYMALFAAGTINMVFPWWPIW